MLRVILGRAGTGKTHRCLQEICEELKRGQAGPPLILLVPEEATFAMEKALLQHSGYAGMQRAQVLGFNRLRFRILQSAGGLPQPPISELGRKMILAGIVRQQRESLLAFGKVAHHPGFLDKLSRILADLQLQLLPHVSTRESSLRRDGVAPDHESGGYQSLLLSREGAASLARVQVAATLADSEASLGLKLQDLITLLTAYQEYIRQHDLVDEVVATRLAAEKVASALFLAGARIWVDGFHRFEVDQLQLISELVQRLDSITVTLRLDSRTSSPQGLDDVFSYTRKTLNSLRHLAAEANVQLQIENIEDFQPSETRETNSCALPSEAGTTNTPVGAEQAQSGGRSSSRPVYVSVPRRYATSPGLAHLEAQLVRPLFRQEVFAAPCEQIDIFEASNRRQEVIRVAGQVVQQVRDCGLKWRDLAVVARDLDEYGDMIADVFAEFGIPFFIDQPRRVNFHPLITFLTGVLEIISDDWPSDAVFQVMKSDLVPVSRTQVDCLENFVLARGINGHNWLNNEMWEYREAEGVLVLQSSFTNLQPGFAASQGETGETPGLTGNQSLDPETALQDAVYHTHAAVMTPLVKFWQKVQAARQKSRPGRELMAALWQLIEDLRIPQRLDAWVRAAGGERGDVSLSVVHGAINNGRCQAAASGWGLSARDHVVVWDLWVNLVDEFIQGLGDRPLEWEEFASIIRAGLDSLRLSQIPPGLDQVLVTTPERLTNQEVTGLFVLGVTEGAFPAAAPEDVVLNDRERELLHQQGFALEPAGRLRQMWESFLLYTTLTRSTGFLHLSCPLATNDGEALLPAPLLRHLKEMFPHRKGVAREVAETERPGTADKRPERTEGLPCTIESAAAWIARQLRSISEEQLTDRFLHCWQEEVLALYDWLTGFPAGKAALKRCLAGLFYSNQAGSLSLTTARRLYGEPLRTNVYSMEAMAACPFKFFAGAGLRLHEREEFRLDARAFGSLLHAAQEAITRKLAATGKDWGEVSDEELLSLCRDVWGTVVQQHWGNSIGMSGRQVFLLQRLGRAFSRSVLVLAEHARRGSFRPVAAEVTFGLGDRLPAWRIPLDNGTWLELRGRIDRVEIAQQEDKLYLRVIDFKLSGSDFYLRDVWEGFSLQLLAYLGVLLEEGQGLFLSNSRSNRVPSPPATRFRTKGLSPGEGKTININAAAALYIPLSERLLTLPGPGSEDMVEMELLKKYKAKGLVLAEPGVILLMDREARGGSSLIPAGIGKNDDRIYKDSSAYCQADIRALILYTKQKLRQLGTRILAGEIDIAPYRRSRERPCTYCPYQPLCRFELGVEGCGYRYIESPSDEEVLTRIQVAVTTDDNTGYH